MAGGQLNLNPNSDVNSVSETAGGVCVAYLVSVSTEIMVQNLTSVGLAPDEFIVSLCRVE